MATKSLNLDLFIDANKDASYQEVMNELIKYQEKMCETDCLYRNTKDNKKEEKEKYKVIGYIKIKDVPDNAFFLYDDIIWNVRKAGKRVFITNAETGQRIADYYKEKNKTCTNPYSILYRKMVKQIKMVSE